MRKHFFQNFTRIPQGFYAHILTLKVTESPTILRTDDNGLNIARTRAGVTTAGQLTRFQMLNRKQTTPERLRGRERLRTLGLLAEDTKAAKGQVACMYNDFQYRCGRCPDCIIYGYATGDKGSQKSKFYGGSLYSLQPFSSETQRTYQRNSVSEMGVMHLSDDSTDIAKNAMHQDHAIAEGVVFPSLETIKDSTYEGFLYVLQNIIQTKRYGATTTRDGRVKTHVVGIVLSDAELFSNLLFTQALYDATGGKETGIVELLQVADQVAQKLLQDEPCVIYKSLFGAELQAYLAEQKEIFRDPDASKKMHTELMTQAHAAYKLYAK